MANEFLYLFWRGFKLLRLLFRLLLSLSGLLYIGQGFAKRLNSELQTIRYVLDCRLPFSLIFQPEQQRQHMLPGVAISSLGGAFGSLGKR
ncbi:MAG: hypothetical protein CYG60_24060 [Actinobacteria bacterium]|nr:MAG: hypothetical protein CYG60_24060 [Actinomycetota bacterium]